MLIPRRTKYRKMQRGGRLSGIATQGNTLSFGQYALQATTIGLVSSRQIESARRVIARAIRRDGKIWIRVFPDKPMTKKGAETPMGKGKGSVDHYVAVVKPGKILFEMSCPTKEAARQALRLAAYKLPVRTRFIASV